MALSPDEIPHARRIDFSTSRHNPPLGSELVRGVDRLDNPRRW